jgi:hypothetical protein
MIAMHGHVKEQMRRSYRAANWATCRPARPRSGAR